MMDRVRVSLTPPNIALSPANPRAELRVGLAYTGNSVEQVAIVVEGVNPAWVALPPVTPLLPGDTAYISLGIQAPPDALTRSQLLPLVVRARSMLDGSIIGNATASVTLSPSGGAGSSAGAGRGKSVAIGLAATVFAIIVALAGVLFWQRSGNNGTPVGIVATPDDVTATGTPDPNDPQVQETRYDGVHLCKPAVPQIPGGPSIAFSTPTPAPTAASAPPARPPAPPAQGGAGATEPLGGGGTRAPYFAQQGPYWGADEYDHGFRQNVGCGTTIANCGCAMTSVATIMALYGVAVAPNGGELNPRVFNDYLNQNARLTNGGWVSDGYVFGGVVWSSANQFTSAAASIRPNTPAVRFRGVGTGSAEEVRAELRAGRPVALGVPGHWVAAVGLDGDRILINDPFYRDRTTYDAYAGRVLESRLYDSSGSMSAMSVTVPADQRAEVRDPRGRVIGTFQGLTPRDAIAQARRQIPNASIFFNEAIRDPNCINKPPPPNAGTITIYIPDPIPGDYQVGVQSPGGGPVIGVVHSYDAGGKVTITTEEGRGAIRFDYSYNPAPGATPTVTPQPTGTPSATPAATETPGATPDQGGAAPPATPRAATPLPTQPPAGPSFGGATPPRSQPATPQPPAVTPPPAQPGGAPPPAQPGGTPPPSVPPPTAPPDNTIRPTPTPPPSETPTPPVRSAPPTPTPTTPPPPPPTRTATATPTPSPTPAAPACPAYTDLLLTGALTSPGPAQPVVTLNWKATGGCAPYTGTLTARYTDTNQPFEQNQVNGSEGIGNSRPTPRTCTTATTLVVQYTLDLRDGSGTNRRQETRVGIPCGPPPTPTPPPCLPVRDVAIGAVPGPPGASLPVTISWSANDGCQPFSGTITGGYVDQGATSDQFLITTSKGLTSRTLPRRTCSVPTTYKVSYRIQLKDAIGTTGTATSGFDVPCSPPPSHRFTGTITNGSNMPLPAGTTIDAFLFTSNSLGEQCGSGKVAAGGAYTIIVLSATEKPGCGSNGQTIHFYVGSAVANPQAPFQSGGNSTVNLQIP